MKRSILLALTAVLFASLHPAPGQVTATLVEDDFAGSAGAAPDAARFTWGGEVSQNGGGFLNFSTDSANTSWLQSRTGSVVSAGSTLALRFTASAYAEGWNPGIYGDKQPRGLRVGNDANNAIEFYSAANAIVGMRVRNGGVGSDQTHAITPGVASMHLYEMSVTSTSAVFKVDGAVTGTFTANLPAGTLNFYVDTFDGYSGNVPVMLDSMRLSLTNAGVAPEIATQPANQTIGIGGNAMFAVTAAGTDPLVYQWFFNSNAIASGTNASFTVSNAQADNAGNYQVIITNDYGSATSSVAVLTIDWATLDSDGDGVLNAADNCPYTFNPDQSDQDGDGVGDVCEDPRITSQPPNQSVNAGATVIFSTAAVGTAPFTYQWQKNNTNLVDGGNISGATTSNLILSSVTLGDAGGYQCSVSNALDWAVTRVAQLQIHLLDSDGDGVPDAADNCPYVCNPSQADHDGNGIGDVCDVPIIMSFSPANGSPGTVITINGANFSAVSGVQLNGTDLSFSVMSDAQLTATVSPGATSGLIAVSNPAGAATSLAGFQVFSPPTDFTYTTNAGAILITGYTGPGGDVMIPDTINGLPVTGIGISAFYACVNLTSVTLPNSVTNLGDYAFNNCANLNAIRVAAANPAFSSLDGVLFDRNQTTLILYPSGRTGSYTVPDGIVRIERLAFYFCRNLSGVVVPNSTTNIGDYAFYHCSGLTNLTIGTNVTSLGIFAFCYCSGLTNLTIGTNVASLGIYAFSGCSSLVDVAIPNSVININDGVFQDCTRLGKITIGNSVTNIGSMAFYDCRSLTNFTMGTNVTRIGRMAFSYCTSLADIQIPNSVASLDDYAFYYCTSLSRIIIPDSVISIGAVAFDGCAGLTNVVLGHGVTSIGEAAFRSCTGLTRMILPDSLTSIGNWTFSYCANLASVTIGNNLARIGDYAFYSCLSLTSFTVGALNPAYSSADGVLFDQSGTLLILCPQGKTGSWIIPDGVASIGNFAFDTCSRLTGITLPNSVTNIGNGAFQNCPGLAEVSIGNQVTTIGYQAFYGCSSLARIIIPDSVTSLGQYAFCSCSSLTNVVIGNRVASIGNAAFVSCINLTRVWIPASVTNIATAAFSGCSSLVEVYFLGDAPGVDSTSFAGDSIATVYYPPWTIGWTSEFGGRPTAPWYPPVPCTFTTNNNTVTITGYTGPGGDVTIPGTIYGLPVTSIGDGAFLGCAGLTSITLGNRVTSIGEGAFAFCTGLARVTLGNNVTNIGSWAFLNCTSLTYITMPNTVNGLGMAAFYSCSSLTEVCFRGNAPGVGSYVFYGANHPAIYYLPGTTGWGAAFGGVPTALWKPRMQTSDGSFGVRTNRFGFNINWASGMVVVVEASTNLAGPAWSPVGTNMLIDESSYFSDPQWTNHPGRFYRLRSP